MEPLDRLVWAGGLCFQAYGWRIGIRVNRREALPRLPACLPPLWEPSAPPFVDHLYSLYLGGPGPGAGAHNDHSLYAGPARIARTRDLDAVFEALESDLQLFLAERARDRTFVHAGVVGWKGQAVVIPGRSFSGKSTLVAALLRAGAVYYSDEYAVLDAHGQVHPYPRRLSLRQPGGGRPTRCSPEELGSRPGAGPLPVGLVVFAHYRSGARWRPRSLTPGEAMLRLLDNTVPIQHRPETALSALQQLAPRARRVQGVRGEAEPMVRALLRQVGS